MDRLERFYRIDCMLKGRRVPVPVGEFLAELGVSRATFMRDLRHLRDHFGAPIVHRPEPAAGGYLYDPDAPAFELPGMWLNPSELQALITCATALDAAEPGLLRPLLGQLRARVHHLLDQAGLEPERVRSRIGTGPRSAQLRPLDPHVFRQASKAVLDRRALGLVYRDRTDGRIREANVDPQRLILHGHAWSLVAWDRTRRGLQAFALDRIRAAADLDEPARPVDPGELDRWLERVGE